jgi:hypothetical protein
MRLARDTVAWDTAKIIDASATQVANDSILVATTTTRSAVVLAQERRHLALSMVAEGSTEHINVNVIMVAKGMEAVATTTEQRAPSAHHLALSMVAEVSTERINVSAIMVANTMGVVATITVRNVGDNKKLARECSSECEESLSM